MGRIDKGERCSVEKCGATAIRSVSSEQASRGGLDIEGARRIYLCELHYKEYKKKSKGQSQVDKWRWGV